jgi:D-glycero-D-manno-heptose 1,7-bisphosphate phosphatase
MHSARDAEFTNIDFVFLDRDGILNRKPPEGEYVTSWEQFQLLPGVEDAIAAINRSHRKAIVVTNQRGVALGLYSLDDLARMHEQLRDRLAARGAHLDAIYVCPHQSGQCNCRKPLTGLFEQAFRDFPKANPANSVMIGDSLRDIEAGHRLGMRTVLVQGEPPEPGTAQLERAASLAQLCVPSLAHFVHQFLCPAHLP